MSPVYQTPRLQPIELGGVLKMIDDLRDQLRNYVNPEPRRWYGTLRRMSFGPAPSKAPTASRATTPA